MFKVTGGIYDKSWIDTLEMSFLVNLGVLAATSYSLNSSINGHREIATYNYIDFDSTTNFYRDHNSAHLLATQEAANGEGENGSFCPKNARN